MIGKVSARGSRVSGLLYYLYRPGRCEEHTDPHLIAGWRHPAELEPPLRQDGHREFAHLSGLLQQPHDALGDRGFDRPVWHCSVRAAPATGCCPTMSGPSSRARSCTGRPTPAGTRLRAAARILSAAAIVTSDPLIAQLRLILQLTALAKAVTGLRTAQRHAAQAGAARAAAKRLYAARRSYNSPPDGRATARAPDNQAAARDFPIAIQQVLAEASAKANPPEPAAPNRPSHGPAPPQQRGPTR